MMVICHVTFIKTLVLSWFAVATKSHLFPWLQLYCLNTFLQLISYLVPEAFCVTVVVDLPFTISCNIVLIVNRLPNGGVGVSCPVFMPKSSTHHMHDPELIILHIQPKVFTDNQISRIKYNYYISNVSKDYDDYRRNRIAEDFITLQVWQPR
jgi:hypothetical protein